MGNRPENLTPDEDTIETYLKSIHLLFTELNLYGFGFNDVLILAIAHLELKKQGLDDLYDIVQENSGFFNAGPSDNKLMAAVRKLKELVEAED